MATTPAETKGATPSQRSHSSSIKSVELPPNRSPNLAPQPNGIAAPSEAHLQPAKPAEKASVKDRITRMFSQRSLVSLDPSNPANQRKQQAQQTQASPSSQPTQSSQPVQSLQLPAQLQAQASESARPSQTQSPAPQSQSKQSLDAIQHQQALLQLAKDNPGLSASSTNGSAQASSTPNSGAASPVTRSQAPSRKGSTTEKMPHEKIAHEKIAHEKGPTTTPPKPAAKSGTPGQYQRFVVDPSFQGGHEHHLKSSRRQEKLVDMFRGLILGKKPEHPEGDLSLVSSWVDNLKQEKDTLAADKKAGADKKLGAVQPASTLIEKYGKCQEIVGRGAFGVVRISHKKLADGMGEKLYAVKEFKRRPEENEKKYSKRLTAEFCISSSLRHPNVIHTLDLLKDSKGDYCEVMEFCAGGDLYTLVLAAGKLEVQEADCFFKQMMRGVEYMHEMGVAHRDLKPENLLLTTHGGLKITDFGNGECFRMAWESDAHMVSGLCGSAPYISPEEYVNKEFDARAVDVWACGVIYMAMRTGRHLWRLAKKDDDEFYARYLDGRRDEEGYGPIESLHRARCRNVIYSILDPNPTRRITASQVLKSEWGREIKLCKAGEEGL
ncbi:protein-serine/threonineeeee kinase [Sporothrix brasiliensis 5110]|uniref:non-specific serine/threonine protein kinase n=1 Tax=Sporothrix brasiliensis 5110 TaxID=1398154 RepID=A0A0C2FGI9_9PEZI|nr:protein-serine/threonineeeee kinase [Sporothrix brasiliensis 5110]KIH90153.1 protein-serine/threonineeeee kinase [Sporothrix brasiliensis 5110]